MENKNIGRVVRVEGPVIDVRFEGELPQIFEDALDLLRKQQ